MKEYMCTIRVCSDGTKAWFLNDVLHREDGPAIEYINGTKKWWFNGKLHREDGPAIEWGDGDKEWWVNGKQHREDGPAIEDTDGDKKWYFNGKLHREDGPAVIYDCETEYWICGYEMSEKTFKYNRHIYIMNKIIVYGDN
jgi:hypothetical protein